MLFYLQEVLFSQDKISNAVVHAFIVDGIFQVVAFGALGKVAVEIDIDLKFAPQGLLIGQDTVIRIKDRVVQTNDIEGSFFSAVHVIALSFSVCSKYSTIREKAMVRPR